MAVLSSVKPVAPVTSPVCVAFETKLLYKLFTALSPVLIPLVFPITVKLASVTNLLSVLSVIFAVVLISDNVA